MLKIFYILEFIPLKIDSPMESIVKLLSVLSEHILSCEHKVYYF